MSSTDDPNRDETAPAAPWSGEAPVEATRPYAGTWPDPGTEAATRPAVPFGAPDQGPFGSAEQNPFGTAAQGPFGGSDDQSPFGAPPAFGANPPYPQPPLAPPPQDYAGQPVQGSMPDPMQGGIPPYGSPYGSGTDYSAQYGAGPYGAPGTGEAPPPYYGYQMPGQQPKSQTGRILAAVLGGGAVLVALVVILVLASDHGAGPANASSTTSASAAVTDTTTATDTATDGSGLDPSDTATADDSGDGSGDDEPTGDVFDPSQMDEADTDPAPFTTDALIPDDFTDSKNVEYALKAGGVEKCVEDSMSDNVRSTLQHYGCSQVLTASYTVDSDTVSSKNDILVSVQVFAFKDEAAAKAVYADFPSDKSWDFGIWCPKSGDGAKPCATNADYDDAYKSEWLGQDYRYVIEATALYTNLTQDSTAQPWTSAAAKEAVNDAGPEYYIASQD